MFSMKILFIFVVFGFAHYANACRCIPEHPQKEFCENDFALIIRPTSKTTTSDGLTNIYNVQLINKIKANAQANTVLNAAKKIQSAVQSATCGVNLDLNQIYLVVGKISNNKATINSCTFNSLLTGVTPYQLQGFFSNYKSGCTSCNIVDCYGAADCQQKAANNACLFDRSLKYECYSDHSYCKKNASGKCEWVSSQALTDCLQ